MDATLLEDDVGAAHPPARASKIRLLMFAAGDFAFNLYWQSVMMFLLFYYTDSIDLPIGIAATTYMVASVWDGIANFCAGMLLERRQSTVRYGMLIAIGGVPLGLSFVLMYLPPLVKGPAGIVIVFAAHLLFRTAYAAVNVPYLAMTARISPDAGDRALVAGARMLFGTAAAVIVALTTVRLGHFLSGTVDPKRAYVAAAAFFAVAGAAILGLVGAAYREQVTISRRAPRDMRAALLSLAHNRAYVTLNAATMAMIVAITVLGKSVLYYFKYILGDVGAGQLALALMFIVSACAIPAWMLLGRFVGLRLLWLIATIAGMLALLLFAGVGIAGVRGMQLFLIAMQVVNIGLNFVFWAMLPNTIEYGEDETGVHVEGSVFGVAALLQRIAIGIATAILGWGFASAGYVANTSQSAATLAGMRATVAFVPLAFFALSCAAMILNPLGRRRLGGHVKGAVDTVSFG
jgi:GPH family glycoside/pentoside/hexuronide:cation symporter